MPYIGAGITRFNTADQLTVTGTSELKNNVTVTGDVTASGTVLPTGDTAAGDAAALGFTSAEGLILTGQGSTSDITVKNDADATVFTVPTGTDDILFPDGAKILMGSGSDLQIHHSSTNSLIDDQGTGNLELRTNGTDIRLTGNSGSDFMVQALSNGAVNLFHDNSQKLATTSSGVDITGGFTATDGCTITTADNTAQLTLVSTDADGSRGPELLLERLSDSPADNDALGFITWKFKNDAGTSHDYCGIEVLATDVSDGSEDATWQLFTQVAGTSRSRFSATPTETVLNEDSQDLDFRVESDGNTHGLFLEASTGELGIGTSTPSTFTDYISGSNAPSVVVAGSQPSYILTDTDISGSTSTFGITKAGVNTNMNNLGAGDFAFTNNGAQRMVIDSDGRTIINATSSNTGSKLTVAGSNTRTSSGSCADEGIVLMPVTNLTTDDYTPWLAFTPRDSSSTPSRARAAIGAVSTSAVAALDMVFATRSAADGTEMTGADEKMRLTSGGNLMLNTTNTSPNPGISMAPSGGITLGNDAGTSGFFFLDMNRSTSRIGSITQSGTTGVAFNTSSDYRLKENVADMTGAIDRVKALAPKRFKWVADDDDRTVDGFLAHEAQAVVPEAVTGEHNEIETWTQQQIDDGDAPDGTSAGDNKLDGDGNTIPVMQGIDQSKLVPLLTAALQEAIAKIETLETKVTALENA